MRGEEDKMLEELREVAGLGGPAASLANELLVLQEQHAKGELSDDEYKYLLEQVAQIRAAQELAADEQAFRYIVSAATTLASIV